MIAKHFFFEGRVQGVGFRATARHIAKGYDVTGWVKNLPDGRVEVLAQAEDAAEVDAFLLGILESGLKGHIRKHLVEPAEPLAKSSGFEITV